MKLPLIVDVKKKVAAKESLTPAEQIVLLEDKYSRVLNLDFVNELNAILESEPEPETETETTASNASPASEVSTENQAT